MIYAREGVQYTVLVLHMYRLQTYNTVYIRYLLCITIHDDDAFR